MTEQQKWEKYEQEKNKLRREPLTDKEYEQAVKKLAEELGI